MYLYLYQSFDPEKESLAKKDSARVPGGLVITCMAHLGTRTRPVTDHTDRYLTVTDRYIAYLPIPPIPSLPEPVLEFRLSANENVMNFH